MRRSKDEILDNSERLKLIKAGNPAFYDPNYAQKSLDLPTGWSSIYQMAQHMASDPDSPVVNTSIAETITAYYICLKIKAETFASINTGVYRLDGDRMIRDMSNPIDYLLSIKPNDIQNAYDWWYATQWLEDLHGNSYSIINRDRSGRPGELTLMDPTEVNVRREDKTGGIYYLYKGKTYADYEVLHFKQNTINGLTGRSDVKMNAETFTQSKVQDAYAKNTFGKKPQGILEDGENLSSEDAQQLAENFVRHVKKGIPPLIYGGLKYKSFAIPPGDAQYIESRQFTKAEICAIKRIPLSMIQDYSRQAGATYNNVGEQKASFYTDVILPGCRSKELEMLTKLISRANHRKLRIKFDHSELMRADPKTMAEVVDKLLTKGVINRNEARAELGKNPIDPNHDANGDKYFVQAGFVWTDQLEEFYSSKNGQTNGKQKNGYPITQN